MGQRPAPRHQQGHTELTACTAWSVGCSALSVSPTRSFYGAGNYFYTAKQVSERQKKGDCEAMRLLLTTETVHKILKAPELPPATGAKRSEQSLLAASGPMAVKIWCRREVE